MCRLSSPPRSWSSAGRCSCPYPAIYHVQYRLTADGAGTKLKLVHRALGLITEEHRLGVDQGWGHGLERVKAIAERILASR